MSDEIKMPEAPEIGRQEVGTPMISDPIPDTTLPRVQFPTGRPFSIQVETPDTLEEELALKQWTHPWKVTYAGEADGLHYWNVKGGEVVTQGGSFTVADYAELEGDGGYICVQITRDEASREATNVEIDGIITALAPPTSDQTYQYIALAYVDSSLGPEERVNQLRFERIEILEEMQVVNGEFKLNAYQVVHDESYSPPTP